MSIGAISGSTPYAAPEAAKQSQSAPETAKQPQSAEDAAKQPQSAEEITTVTTHCEKKHAHNQSCPHTVTTRPAPKAGEKGYLLDKLV